MEWILELRREISVPNTLRDLGLRDEHAAAFCQQAFDDPSTGGNPVPMTADGFRELYKNCIHGRLSS